MTDLWVRQVSGDNEPPQYRWYHCESGEYGSSTPMAMAARWPEATLTLLIAGTDCPSRRLQFKPEEKRHLARLIPYELEADLAQEVAGLHVALGSPLRGQTSPGLPDGGNTRVSADAESEVVVSYIGKHELAERIAALETAGLDVRHCYAEPLLLPATASAWVLRLTDDQVDVSWGKGAAASIELSMLGALLDALMQAPAAAAATAPELLILQALTQQELDELTAQVSSSGLMQTWQPGIEASRLSGSAIWDDLCRVDNVSPAIPDLRQGAFARPVRWQKIWQPLRLPLIAAGLAAMTFASVTLLETQLNNQRFRSLQHDMEAAYREVVPAGVLVDAEQQLRTQLAQLRGGSADGSVLVLLDRLAPALAQNAQISINRLSYNGGGSVNGLGELQLSVEAASNTDILQFSEQLSNGGLQARAQNMTQSGTRQQASLMITETMP